MIRFCILSALIFCWIFSAFPQPREAAILEMMKEAHIPGLSLAYFEGDKLIVSRGYGYKSVESQEPVDEETVFAAASLSKPILAYIVMKLSAQQILDLDTPLHTYFKYKSLKHGKRYHQVTARMVLTHSSGLPNWRRIRLKFRHAPGTQFSYSGEGFVWLQKTVEHLTQQSLSALAQEMVFTPLGMHRTSYVWNNNLAENYALPHTSQLEVRNKTKPQRPNAAHSLQTTAHDYARFLIALNQPDSSEASLVRLMLSPQIVAVKKGKTREGVNWGLGVGLHETTEGLEFWHWGDNGTFKAYCTASPSRQRGIVYFANSSRGLSITSALVALFMGSNQPGWEWNGYKHYQEE